LFSLQWQNLVWLVVGCALGMLWRHPAGVSGLTMLAVVLPIMYKMSVSSCILALWASMRQYVFQQYMGILYNIPGGAPACPPRSRATD
jgi:TctA family transporter